MLYERDILIIEQVLTENEYPMDEQIPAIEAIFQKVKNSKHAEPAETYAPISREDRIRMEDDPELFRPPESLCVETRKVGRDRFILKQVRNALRDRDLPYIRKGKHGYAAMHSQKRLRMAAINRRCRYWQ